MSELGRSVYDIRSAHYQQSARWLREAEREWNACENDAALAAAKLAELHVMLGDRMIPASETGVTRRD